MVWKLSLIFIFLLGSSISLLSKEQQSDELLNRKIRERVIELNSELNFTKASLFFLEDNWDSTLVYSLKQLNEKSSVELKDYSHYYRGISFKKKKVFKEAQKELSLVSNKFYFYKKVMLSLGELALELREYQKAIPYFQKINELPDKEFYEYKKSTAIHNLGLCYLHLGKFSEAEKYLTESVKLQEQKKDTMLLIGSYGDIANLYYEQYKDDLAIPYFEKAYKLSKKIKSYKLRQNTALNMAAVEENRENFQLSLVYRKEYEIWKDSLNDQNKVWEIAQAEKKQAIQQKQEEVRLLQAENRIKVTERNGLLYSAIILIILLVTSVYFYTEKVKSNKIIVIQKERLDELNASKDKLFSVVSHDLRSNVNALKTSNIKLQDELAGRGLEELDALVENSTSIANSTYNLLDNLLHWALLQTKQSYFEIVPMRLFFIVEQVAYNYESLMASKNIQYENSILKNDMVYADQETLKIILRNLLDNAIKYSHPHGKIKIYSRNTNDNYYELIIEDIGRGIDESIRLELLKETVLLPKRNNGSIIGTGLGLHLCKSLIQSNKGKFFIESKVEKGTKIIVSLPKHNLPQNG